MSDSDEGHANDMRVEASEAAAYRRLVTEFPTIRLVVCRPDGRPVAEWVGEDVARLSGYVVAEFEADPDLWLSIVHPADREKALAACGRLGAGPHDHEQYRIYRKDGQMRWISDTGATASPGASGLVRSVRCVADISQLNEAEAALRTSQDLLTAVQDSLPANIAVIDGAGTIITVNERWKRFARENGDPELASTCEGANYLHACERADSEAREDGAAALEGLTAILRGETNDFEMEYPCEASGECRWFLLRAAPLGGGRAGAVIAHIDITERKRAEEAVRKSEARYRSLVENLDAVVFRIDRSFHPLALAGRMEQVLGYTAEEVVRHASLLREIVHPDDLTKVWELLERTEALRIPQLIELRARHRTGQTRWIRGTLTPLFDQDGPLLYFDGVCLDVTERKVAEEARRESEERYRSLVDSLDAIIFRTGPDNMLLALYGRVAEQTGYTVAEFMNDDRLWIRILHPQDMERVLRFHRDLASTGERHGLELRIVQKSGAVRWVRAQITPRYDESGSFIYFDGVGLDITERIDAEEREARRTSRMAILTELSQELAASLDAQQILDVASRRLCETLESVSIGITLEPSSQRLLHLSVCCPHDCEVETMDRAMRRPNLTVDEVFGEAGVTPRLVPDLRQVSAVAARFADAAADAGLPELGPAVLVPVTAGADAVGVLVSSRPSGQEFDQEDLWFATEVASHASAALANAALYRRQARIAENLQRSLIAAEPALDCLDIATLYAPAPGEAEVGGDFFDIFSLNGSDLVGLVVGDVSGKGLDAAIHTAETKYMLRAFVHQDPDPLRAMTALNKALCDYLPDETFVTLVYLLINAREHTITYVSAGHEPCLVRCRGRNAFREIKPGGPMLGVTQSASYVAGEARLEPDDALFCYTDGVIEVRCNGEQFGYERLRQAVAAAPSGDSRSIVEYVIGKVREFGAARQTDDQVVVVARPLV